MPQCDECENHVTADFHRVFSDNEDMLYGCPDCMSMTDIKDGKVTGLQSLQRLRCIQLPRTTPTHLSH